MSETLYDNANPELSADEMRGIETLIIYPGARVGSLYAPPEGTRWTATCCSASTSLSTPGHLYFNQTSRLIIFNTTDIAPARLHLSLVLPYDSVLAGPTINASVRIEPVDFTCESPTELRVTRLNPGDSVSATFRCEVPYNSPRTYRYVLHIPEEGIHLPAGFRIDLTDPRTFLTTRGHIDACLSGDDRHQVAQHDDLNH